MTVQELYEKTGGSYDAAKKILPSDALIARFVVKLLTDGSMQKLRDGYAAKDAQVIFEGAHALKGVTANLGFYKMSELAAEIADEFRPGRERKLSDAELDAMFAEVSERYDSTVREIEKFKAQ